MADLLATLPLILVLGRLSWIDAREHRIPDRLSLPLLAAGLALAAWRMGGVPPGALAGAVTGWAVFAGLGALFHRRYGAEGLGRGDAKLLGAAGAWLGLGALPLLVLFAALAALCRVFLRPAPKDAPIAFGPWLSLAFLVLWAGFLSGRVGGAIW
ncbi:prepilin peptidase [Oceaniglobus trochenteri]|uniref:prepilin peptidase n=1 Tax=Oceaniglobus trochenteri TaxID=2763260 RepID=UPI001CFFA055|nr:A24 family peptidase [Oceaniglobus trochenteri]